MCKKSILMVALVVFTMALNGCTANNQAEESLLTYARSQHYNEELDHDHDLSWSHANQGEWYFSTGRTQSPINIVSGSAAAMQGAAPLLLNYPSMADKIYDTGHDIHVKITGSAMINNRPFSLLQFHLHSPSEHTIDGNHYPLELHFMHVAQNGQLAVVGVMFEEGNENEAMGQILEALESSNILSSALDTGALLPSDLSFYHYRGSLTTPPLTENVDWYVLANPVQMSTEQLNTMRSYYNDNNREVQPLYDRPLLSYTSLK